MKTILITGSNGLLGQKLTDLYLQLSDIQLIATGTGENKYSHSVGYTYVSLDITDFDAVRDVVATYKPSCIINAAAMTNVDACEIQASACKELNVDAVENLAKLSVEFGFHLIHLSTDFIFDGTKKMYVEEDIANPLSIYGKSKMEAEQVVQATANNWSIVRTAIVFGFVNSLSRTNIVLWAIAALKKGEKMNVVNDQFRTPTLAEDLALGCRLIEKSNAQGIFNISGADYMSIAEMVQRIALHIHCSSENVNFISSDSLNQPAKRPPTTGLNIEKAKSILGYRPQGFETSLDLVLRQLGV